ncbi:Cryptochrome DASH [Verticillium dahliae VDG1]|nr:Cryptochrome DASH [Verticillium dahliae VDG1]
MSEPQPHPPVALITAGSAGLGAAAAKLLARKGYRVVINYYSNKARADALETELHTLSPLPHDAHNFLSVQANLESRDEIKSLVQAASDFSVQGAPPATNRRLDVVFSNGGWTQIRDIRNLDDNLVEDDWDRCFNMNVKSHLWLMGAVKPYLEEAEGCFITTASLAGVKVSGSSLAYAVSKAAQIHLAKGLAMAAAPKIRVNTVSPGIMWTDWGLQFPEEQREAARERTPLKRVPTVEEVAEQVWCFIQSKTVTGANAVIDGGFSRFEPRIEDASGN